MLDLRVLRDLWTEGGARDVFEMLLAQCVRFSYPMARTMRPDPGDEAIDTFAGELKSGTLRVWQAKYFADGVKGPQQAQIRASFSTCIAKHKNLGLWTLCVPTPLSPDEERWWEKWRKAQSKKHKCTIELWDESRFVGFQAKPELAPVFDMVLRRNGFTISNIDDLQRALPCTNTLAIVSPTPTAVDALRSAVFVRKLEAAQYREHRAARTAFYNFEFLKTYVQEGGPEESEALAELSEKVFSVWEDEFNERAEGELGRTFVVAMNKRIDLEHNRLLRTALPAQSVHKRGCLYYWADICQAGWTVDFRSAVTGVAADVP